MPTPICYAAWNPHRSQLRFFQLQIALHRTLNSHQTQNDSRFGYPVKNQTPTPSAHDHASRFYITTSQLLTTAPAYHSPSNTHTPYTRDSTRSHILLFPASSKDTSSSIQRTVGPCTKINIHLRIQIQTPYGNREKHSAGSHRLTGPTKPYNQPEERAASIW